MSVPEGATRVLDSVPNAGEPGEEAGEEDDFGLEPHIVRGLD